MKTHYWKTCLGGLLSFCLCALLPVHAQQRGGGGFGGGGFGGGGFGGFGGGGGGGNNNQARGNTGSYTPNGQVGGATFSIDDSGNLVVIADEATIAEIRKVVANLDQPKPQVLIKVVFLEVQHSDASDIGIEGTYNNQNKFFSGISGFFTNFSIVTNFTSVGSNLVVSGTSIVPTSITPIHNSAGINHNFGLAATGASPIPPGAGLYSILGSDFTVTLRAIAQAGKAQLLSRPSILARDRQPATIVVGQSVPLITSVSYQGLTGNPINNVTYTDVGIILRVTPYITPDGMVQMIVSPQTSAIDPTLSVPISLGVNAPVIDVRSADTVAITPDGQTVVIGGLMASDKSQSDSKIPFLGDIPFLGNLFKRKVTSGTKTELLIFLTPHIVQTPTMLAGLTAKEQSQNKLIQKSVSEEELDRFLERVPMKKTK